jgi:ferritin-like metal-binding protein YciE
MKMNSLTDLLLDEVADLYTAERRVSRALRKMAKAASSATLREAFTQQSNQKGERLKRLEVIFQNLGAKPRTRKSMSIKGALADGKLARTLKGDPRVRDEVLIRAAQRLLLIEIAEYEAARTHARLSGLEKVAKRLDESLAEEIRMSETLSSLSQGTKVRTARAA